MDSSTSITIKYVLYKKAVPVFNSSVWSWLQHACLLQERNTRWYEVCRRGMMERKVVEKKETEDKYLWGCGGKENCVGRLQKTERWEIPEGEESTLALSSLALGKLLCPQTQHTSSQVQISIIPWVFSQTWKKIQKSKICTQINRSTLLLTIVRNFLY